jgi:neurofibromin 1
MIYFLLTPDNMTLFFSDLLCFVIRYFTLFMNLLNDCTDAQDVEKDVSRQRLAAGKLNTLHNATIQAMSNLLSANIDSGLMHSIGKR